MIKKTYLLLLFVLAALQVGAQNIRYVSKSGAYANDGTSWGQAKLNIQDAINDLVDKGLTGEVWVAEGTYTPTESTESSGGSTLYLSFKIPAGISVYGGFKGTETSKDQREMVSYAGKQGYQYKNKTILSGNLSAPAQFTWNATKQQWNTSFYGNSYHVVWFATNGFDSDGRAKALNAQALLEGCFITGGNARNSSTTVRSHTAYGGGIYMVENAVVRRCYIYNCEASRDGGGVYMDGGGLMEQSYVVDCQALGVSIENGYGGGVALEANKTSKAFGMKQGAIINCVARMGGGLAVNIDATTASTVTNIAYKPYASSVLVSNNTATSEGGGVYLNRGGALEHMTIVRNRNNGPGVVNNGITNGRAAGLYVRDRAYLLNSVMWGGEVAANNNIQFASSRSASSDNLKTTMNYCALSKNDYVDWSGTTKTGVISLSDYNNATEEQQQGGTSAASMGYPDFYHPAPTAGYMAGIDDVMTSTVDWHFYSSSSLINAGLQSVDLDETGVLPFPEQSRDLAGSPFNPHSSLGAFVSDIPIITPLVSADGNTYSIYVDDNVVRTTAVATNELGNSWETALRYLGNALHYARLFQDSLKKAGQPLKTFNIYVKEGNYPNTNSYVGGRVRNIPISMAGNVTLYGGYPDALKGTDVSRRNPVRYPSVITGYVNGNYEYNVAHLFVIEGDWGTPGVLDGFQIRYANATSQKMGNTNTYGAAITIKDGAYAIIRNTVIAGCQADRGAAVYVESGGADFYNCIIHNNTTTDLVNGGVIYTAAGSDGIATVGFEHCDFLRNVGYVGYNTSATGFQQYVNSIFFANMDRAVDNTNTESGGGIQYALPAFAGLVGSADDLENANITGSNCFFDSKSAQFAPLFGGNTAGQWQYNLQYTFGGGQNEGYPRFVNPTKNTGVSPGGDITFNGRATSFEPNNTNPIVNAASYSGAHTTWGTDMSTVTTRDYGGLPDVGALENHQTTHALEGENANIDGQLPYGAAFYVRDYNTYSYDAEGNVTATLTTDTVTVGRDGTSWQRAYNGNGVYRNNYQVVYNLVQSGGFMTSSVTNPIRYKIVRNGTARTSTTGSTGATTYATVGDVLTSTAAGTGVRLTTTMDAADHIDFFLASGGYYIYDFNQGKYLTYDANANTVSLTAPSGSTVPSNAIWTINVSDAAAGSYIIRPSTATGKALYYNSTNGTIALSTTTTAWQFYIADDMIWVNGLQQAVNDAHQEYKQDKVTRKVMVGAGRYQMNKIIYDTTSKPGSRIPYTLILFWKDGADMLGGYPNVGTPGESERDISNKKITHRSIIDGNANGSAIAQFTDFADTTMIEGFVIRNGRGTGTNYGAGIYMRKNGLLKNCLVENNAFVSDARTGDRQGGAGVYLNKGSVVKNCIIRRNTINGDGKTSIFIGGAGVFSNGGTLQNSLIVENTTTHNYHALLGAGFYISSYSELYNCTIAYNVGINSGANPATGGVWDGPATHIGNGVYTGQSKFYNCIMWGNYATGSTAENFIQVGMSGFSSGAGKTNDAFFTCYSSAINSTYASDDATQSDKVRIIGGTVNSTSAAATAFYNNCKAVKPFVRDASGNTDYSLKSTALECINKGGSEDVLLDLDIIQDISGADRVQDCTVDKGAYEYNDAYAISPDLTSVSGQAIFYVTPEGKGLASAASPGNAACAAKLQKVLDAAGRYKYLYKDKRVIVKLANSAADAAAGTPFTYYANRTTRVGEQDVRIWSIIVPRGVEVWGGYTDTYTSATDNGFYTGSGSTYKDLRNITGNPTYLDATYYNKAMRANAYAYHVVTFTDQVFDANGTPYLKTNTVGSGSTFVGYEGNTLMSMKDDGGVTDRAVIDGVFVTGGNANLTVTSSGTQVKDIYQFGGAAIVTDYAHVRNCIIRGNKATYGGALALTQGALVSGTLIDQNTAEYGGALYIFEDGTQLSDGTTVSSAQGTTTTLDGNMPHVYTSTIVNNRANSQGGGVWFSQSNPNVRFNSTIIWANDASDQANVAGLFNPDRPNTQISSGEFYPFAYSAVQNLRLSGVNNIQLVNLNREGTRFHKGGSTDAKALAVEDNNATGFAKYSDFRYYGLTNYFVLVKAGMSVTVYDQLKQRLGLADADFTAVDRKVGTARSYIDIGARAIDKEIDLQHVMLRLYVARPEVVNMDAAETMMAIPTDVNASGYDANKAYYAQEGSSFAYPMQSLQDALDYIATLRTVKEGTKTLASPGANNLPFEIVLSAGTFYPSRGLTGNYGFSRGNTFTIPEGVTLMGGFAVTDADDGSSNTKTYYGRYLTPGTIQAPVSGQEYSLDGNTVALTARTVTIGDITIYQEPLDEMGKRREQADINLNSIIEPWEFTNTTTLSGNVNGAPGWGVYHVVTAFPDEGTVGALPTVASTNASYVSDNSNPEYGYMPKETGQPITIDGITVTNGYAETYQDGTLTEIGKYYYYQGGGLTVNGSRYKNQYNDPTVTAVTSGVAEHKHEEVVARVGYRDIPVIINKCLFTDNHASYGGAISTNTSLAVYSSSFQANTADYKTDRVPRPDGTMIDVQFAGQGGAIYNTWRLSAVNTIFANNEAVNNNYSSQATTFNTYSSTGNQSIVQLGGVGGAILMGSRALMHIFNCNFVNNQANVYPAIYTRNPNREPSDDANDILSYNQIANTVFWGNAVNSGMATAAASNPIFAFAGKLMTNFRKKGTSGVYLPRFDAENAPQSQADLDANFTEMAWFSAYEDGRGITPDNDVDLRAVPLNPSVHVVTQLTTYAQDAGADYQNCNVRIDSENASLDGPNFTNPSQRAGYDGYVESADWSPARLNRLSDNGSGMLEQTIGLTNGVFTATFKTYQSDSDVPSAHTSWSTEAAGDYVNSGTYTGTKYTRLAPQNRKYLPLGTEKYMRSVGSNQDLLRISYDPSPSHLRTYIDIGVYEYVHSQLTYTTEGDEVDILWVSPVEKPENGQPDGSSWKTPTSDLQRAIERLLSSRNGHRKEIRLLDGPYTPIYNINNKLAFTIDTRGLNPQVETPLDANNNALYGLGVKSLTIKGGYSQEFENLYDVDQYQAVFRQQNRADASSDKWDHLFYIVDATQRLGLSAYTEENEYGWLLPNDQTTVNTIPIEIDGVKIVNNQARPDTKGAAIYYGPQTFDASTEVTTDASAIVYRGSTPTPANISKVIYYTDATKQTVSAVPTAFYERTGLTYYTDATYTTVSETPTQYAKGGFAEKTNPAKLIISKTSVLGTGTYTNTQGTADKTTSAIYIAAEGGTALLYNNVVHSNYGDPVVSMAQTLAVNNTFALNAGQAQFLGGTRGTATDNALASKIFNNVFWRNNADASASSGYGDQVQLMDRDYAQLPGWECAHNAYTGGPTVTTDYSDGGNISQVNYNVGLSTENNDVNNGPNFIDPLNADLEARNFDLKPSLRLLNHGNDALYNDILSDDGDGYTIYDLAWLPTTRHEALSDPRFFGTIDIGAYEYQKTLERVLYVNPNSAVTGLGTSWASPFGFGNLQAAIDMAAIYNVNNPTKEAYVFVKGASTTNANLHTGETLEIRNGVSVYGGISPSYTVDVARNLETSAYDDATLADYVQTIIGVRRGVVGPLANKTAVLGIKVSPQTVFSTENGIASLVDGFDVTATTTANTTGRATGPVIDVKPATPGAAVALRNIVVHDNNTAAAGTNVAEISNALIYEALFRTNTVATGQSVLKLGTGGYAVNITAEGKTTGADGSVAYNALDADGNAVGNIYNSLVNYAGHDETEKTLSGYNYALSRPNLNYQLTEKSPNIDACAAENLLTTVAPTLATFINYATDLDLLGNLRLLKNVTSANKIDRGAFETWRVDQREVRTTETNYFNPTDGSMVYIMERNNLVLGAAIKPGYLLLKEGGSLYGQGNRVQLAYAGIERTAYTTGQVMSFPVTLTRADIQKVAYDDNGVLTLTEEADDIYVYNGQNRSNWAYDFRNTESGSWTASLFNTTYPANTGGLYKPATDGLHRFTGKGANMDDYTYEEDPTVPYKSVVLTQYDDYQSTNGGADFTSKEDMGWNLFGMPYMVSTYKPYAKETYTGYEKYNIDVPHTMWLYYDGVNGPDGQPVNGDGGFYSVDSWKSTAADWHLAEGTTPIILVGEGIFMQTAVVGSQERLDFYRPVYDGTIVARSVEESEGTAAEEEPSMAKASLKRYYVGTQAIQQEEPAYFSIQARGHMIYVTGLQGDEQITIYDSVGKIYNMARATGPQYSTAVPMNGLFVVKVNEKTKKVVVR